MEESNFITTFYGGDDQESMKWAEFYRDMHIEGYGNNIEFAITAIEIIKTMIYVHGNDFPYKQEVE